MAPRVSTRLPKHGPHQSEDHQGSRMRQRPSGQPHASERGTCGPHVPESHVSHMHHREGHRGHMHALTKIKSVMTAKTVFRISVIKFTLTGSNE